MRKLNVTDRRTDGQTDGRTDRRTGALQYLPSPGLRRRREITGPTAPAGDKKRSNLLYLKLIIIVQKYLYADFNFALFFSEKFNFYNVKHYDSF